MALPGKVDLYEVGPREGFQLEPPTIGTADKARLIGALAATGLHHIEATAFVSPKWVPQMADAESLVAMLPFQSDVAYTSLYLNQRGLERAAATPNLTVDGLVMVAASDTFSRRNMNISLPEAMAALPDWVTAYGALGRSVTDIGVMAAFGCNYEGTVPLEHVLELVKRAIAQVAAHGHQIRRVRLYDTMGWANPLQVKRTVEAVWSRWPELQLRLHFHDTRGIGMANVYAALEAGVSELETAIGGLGGCPFAGNKSAAGNVPTEDVAFLCAQMGIPTGVSLERLVGCVALAEEIVGRTLPGKLGHALLQPV